MAKGQIGFFQAPGQLRLHGAELHGIGARLEHRQNARRPDAPAQAVDGAAQGRRVVGKVVVNRDRCAATRQHDAGAHLQAPFHALKIGQRLRRLRRGHAHVVGCGQRRQGVELVVHAAQRPAHARHLLAVLAHGEIVGFADGAVVAAGGTKAALRTPAALVQHACQALLQAVEDHAPAGRYGAQQVVELAFDVGQAGEDVGVVVLQVVQHRRARAVVHELAALVEEGGVVLVGFDDKARALAQAGGNAEIQRHAADQKAGLQAGRLQYPGQHGGGRGLAVGAGHGQHMATLQHMLGQPLRAAGVGRAAVQNRLHQRELGCAVLAAGAANDVADDVHVGLQRHLLGAKALDQFDAERAQLIAHGRVDGGVAAGHTVAGFARQRGHAAHESAANAQDMYMHAGILGLWSFMALSRMDIGFYAMK